MSTISISALIEEGIVGTIDVDVQHQQQALASSSWWGRKRYAKVFVSVTVMVTAIVAVIIALSTWKKQVVKEANSSLILDGTEAIEDNFPFIVSL